MSTLLAALGEPARAAGEAPHPAPCPAPTSHNFSSQTPGKDGGLSKGLGWSKEVVAG